MAYLRTLPRPLGGQDRRPGRRQGRAGHRLAGRGRGRRRRQAVRRRLRRRRPAGRDRGGPRGPECSLLVLCDGRRLAALAPAQDFKRLGDGDPGPNTGGMGAYSPVPVRRTRLVDRLVDEAVGAAGGRAAGPGHRLPRRALRRADADRRRAQGARVQRALRRPRDPGGAAPAGRRPHRAAGRGGRRRADHRAPASSPDAAVCVVLASEGYPDAPRTGDEIAGLAEAGAVEGVTVFHAGTAAVSPAPAPGPDAAGAPVAVRSAGGRVLGVTALADSIGEARIVAYAGWRPSRGRACSTAPTSPRPPPVGTTGSARRTAPDRDRRHRRQTRPLATQEAPMIPRYAPAEMAGLFSDEARFAMWLRVELLATEGWAEVGDVPAAAAEACRARAPEVDAAFVEAVGRAREGHRPRRGRLRRRGPGGHRAAGGLVDPLRPHLLGRGGHRPVRHPDPGRRPAHRGGRRPGPGPQGPGPRVHRHRR